MPKKGKRAKITRDGLDLIIRRSLEYPRLPRTIVAQKLQEELKAMGQDVPEIEVLERKISRFRNHPESPQDKDWSLETLNDYPISAEALPSVLKAWLYNQEVRKVPLTIREAKWVARLYPFYDDDIQLLAFSAQVQSWNERQLELAGGTMDCTLLHIDLYERATKEKLSEERRNKLLYDTIHPSARVIKRKLRL